MITLRTGKREAFSLVAATVSSLEYLFNNDLTVAHELVWLACDPGYKLSAQAEGMLRAFYLLQEDGTLHSSIRNIVLAATEGKGLSITLRKPVLW